MIDKNKIIDKYIEVYYQYYYHQIDNYDTFIRSRVIEHFLNASDSPIDELSPFVNDTIDGEWLAGESGGGPCDDAEGR
jgi:hypothetical protein